MVTEDKNKMVYNSKANILIIRWHHLNSHSGWRHFMAVHITFNCCCGSCNSPTDKFQHFPQAVEWTSVSVSVWETNRNSLEMAETVTSPTERTPVGFGVLTKNGLALMLVARSETWGWEANLACRPGNRIFICARCVGVLKGRRMQGKTNFKSFSIDSKSKTLNKF